MRIDRSALISSILAFANGRLLPGASICIRATYIRLNQVALVTLSADGRVICAFTMAEVCRRLLAQLQEDIHMRLRLPMPQFVREWSRRVLRRCASVFQELDAAALIFAISKMRRPVQQTPNIVIGMFCNREKDSLVC